MSVHFTARCCAAICLSFVALPISALAAESASDLAAALRAKQEGSTFVRVRMQLGSGENFQLQIKSRVSRDTSDIVYQMLFPKERKGEAVLLHRSGGRFTGTLFIPPNAVRSIVSGQINQPLFGSDLSYEDIIESPYWWSQQAIVGTEVIDNTPCQILESKPGKGHNSSYSSVKTWVDPRRFVPLRIEKYGASGKLVRRINTTRIVLDGGDSIPANLSVQGPRGTTTEIDGSRIKRGVTYKDIEFTVDGLKQLSAPPGSP
jgi:outer membrane lipoprotein-sorting protein